MKRNIILIGTMGSGKSHLGRNLAEVKGWQFVDTDRLLERRYNLPIAQIYEKLGEKLFRAAEREILKKVCLYHEAVISVGGNFPIDVRTLRYLQRYAYIVGIRAANHRIVKRVNRRIGKRPTMDYENVGVFVESMIRIWKPLYKKCDLVIDTTYGRTEDLIERIHEAIEAEGVLFKKRRPLTGGKRREKSGDTN